jgi:hypothetical protein
MYACRYSGLEFRVYSLGPALRHALYGCRYDADRQSCPSLPPPHPPLPPPFPSPARKLIKTCFTRAGRSEEEASVILEGGTLHDEYVQVGALNDEYVHWDDQASFTN